MFNLGIPSVVHYSTIAMILMKNNNQVASKGQKMGEGVAAIGTGLKSGGLGGPGQSPPGKFLKNRVIFIKFYNSLHVKHRNTICSTYTMSL